MTRFEKDGKSREQILRISLEFSQLKQVDISTIYTNKLLREILRKSRGIWGKRWNKILSKVRIVGKNFDRMMFFFFFR